MRLNAIQKVFSVYFGILVVFWLYLHFSLKTTDGFGNYFFSFAFSLVPLIGGAIGMFFSKTWGGFKSVIGRAVFFISLGSFSWGFGSMVWSYYNFFQSVAAPYPGIADIGFLAGSLFWIIGIMSLSHISGSNAGFKKKQGKIILSVSAIVVAVFSYYLLVVVARGGVITQSLNDYLKLFFDLAYPLGDVLILSFTLAVFGLLIRLLGGRYKLSIYTLLGGFTFMYLADFVFSYTTTVGTFYNGNFGDLLFAVALWLITFGTLGFGKSLAQENA